MDVVLARFVNAVATGSIYALLTTGFNVLILVSGIFQYAYAHIVVFSMYVCWMVLEATGSNLAMGISAAIGAGIGMSLLTEPLFRPLVKRGAALGSFILSLAMAMILSDAMNRQIHRGVAIGFPEALSGKEAVLRYGIATLTLGQLATIIGSVIAVAGFMYLLYRTKQGRALRAIGESPDTARLLGIPITKANIYSYAIAGLLGGVSSIFLVMTLGAAAGPLGDALALKVLAIAIFAGLGNLRGGLMCAFILGLVESFVMGYLPGQWTNAIAFGMILAVVMWRPQGLFGLRT